MGFPANSSYIWASRSAYASSGAFRGRPGPSILYEKCSHALSATLRRRAGESPSFAIQSNGISSPKMPNCRMPSWIAFSAGLRSFSSLSRSRMLSRRRFVGRFLRSLNCRRKSQSGRGTSLRWPSIARPKSARMKAPPTFARTLARTFSFSECHFEATGKLSTRSTKWSTTSGGE